MWPDGNRTSNFLPGIFKKLAESRSPGTEIARRYYVKQKQKARESSQPEAGGWRLEAGGWGLGAGGWSFHSSLLTPHSSLLTKGFPLDGLQTRYYIEEL
jgi:hypothetical protein